MKIRINWTKTVDGSSVIDFDENDEEFLEWMEGERLTPSFAPSLIQQYLEAGDDTAWLYNSDFKEQRDATEFSDEFRINNIERA